jgi:hypothetical protein
MARSFGQFRSNRKIFRDNLPDNSRFSDKSSYNIRYAWHRAVVVTHQFHRSWLRRYLWKFACTTGRGRKTGQVKEHLASGARDKVDTIDSVLKPKCGRLAHARAFHAKNTNRMSA